MEKRLFNQFIKTQLLSRGFEKTAPNDYAITANDNIIKLIVRAPDQTRGFIIGVQFSDYGEFSGKFSQSLMKNYEYEHHLSFAQKNDYTEAEVTAAIDTVLLQMQPYLVKGKDAIREHLDQWVFGISSDKIRNEVLACIGLPTVDPYSKEYRMEQVGLLKNGGAISLSLEEYLSHKEYYDQYANYGGSFAMDKLQQQVHIYFPPTVKIFCKIITADCAANTEVRITTYITEKLNSAGALDITFSSLVPYWKTPGQGELCFHFLCRSALKEIQQLFADTWQGDTADAQWSNIHCPGAVFLWISQ